LTEAILIKGEGGCIFLYTT